LSPAQVARELGVDERTVRRWIVAGVIPAQHTVTGYHLVAPSTVTALQQLSSSGIPLNTRTLRGRFNSSPPPREDRQPKD
jgi:hypothetical protein